MSERGPRDDVRRAGPSISRKIRRTKRHKCPFSSRLTEWALDADAWQIVALNAQLLETGTAEEEAQFRWLETRLARRDGPVGFMLHKPLFRDGSGDTEAHVRYVPAKARRRLLDLLATRDLRFVVIGHAHQARRLWVAGVEHVWAPSTAFSLPEAMRERMGEKTVGVLRLELSDGGHGFALVTPEGLTRHNIHPEAYPEVVAVGARCM